MKVAILGAGFAGLTAAHELVKKGVEVHVFEKSTLPGGAAGGFKRDNWDWYVDYAYHHWFTTDADILHLCAEIGYKDALINRPMTASLYNKPIQTIPPGGVDRRPPGGDTIWEAFFPQDTQEYKLDSPLDILTFDRISFIDRVRTGLLLAVLRFGPPLKLYHSTPAHAFLKKYMGDAPWRVLWEPLFRHKFEDYADKINTMFFWARIHARTPSLAYPPGGYQELANYFSTFLQKKGVHFHYENTISDMHTDKKKNNVFILECTVQKKQTRSFVFDAVISTLPSPALLEIEKNVLPKVYRTQLEQIKYLGAQTAIYEMRQKVLPRAYWLNIALKTSPWMVAVQHTNFVPKKYFNNHHILYMATYTNKPLAEKVWRKKNKNIVWQTSAFIQYAQPLYTTDYHTNMPQTTTPVTGLYIANMERTYPFDRGTNNAVIVGKQAATAVIKEM